jgi:hypothetical protein
VLFCISLLPLTEQLHWLNTVREQHTTTRKILRLFYMDSLKLVGKPEEEPQKRMQTAKTFSGGSYMDFRLDTCFKIVLKKKGKLVHLQ